MKNGIKAVMLIILTGMLAVLPACNSKANLNNANSTSGKPDLFAEEEQFADYNMTKYVLTPVTPVGDEELKAMANTMIMRLNEIYQYRNNFTVNDGKIYVLIENKPGIEDVLKDVMKTDSLKMKDADGVELFDASGVFSAEKKYGVLTAGGEKEYFVEIVFTQRGQEAFAKATRIASERTDGNNYLDVVLGDNPVTTRLSATKEINSKVCRIPCGTSEGDALRLAVTIQSGTINVEFNMDKYVEPADDK